MKLKSISLFIISISLLSCGRNRNTISPERKNLVQAVYASGKIFPLNDYKVYSKIPAYVEEIHVKVGDMVKAGQPLLTLRNEVNDLNIRTAKNAYELARENSSENSAVLNALKDELASAKSKLQLDSINFTRFRNLFAANATSKVNLDNASTQFDISKRNYQRIFNNLIATKQRLQLEFKNAENQYQAQQVNKKDYVLYAIADAKVYDITVRDKGEFVTSQQALVELGDPSRFEVELNIDETDIGLVKTGQKVRYEIDAYKGEFPEGVISETYPRISAGNKTSRVISTIQTNKTLFSGMSVEANILISKKNNVLVIPREFIQTGNQVKLQDGSLKKIKTGVEDLQYVEVVEGLDENSRIKK